MSTGSAWYSNPYLNNSTCKYTHGIIVDEAIEMLTDDQGSSLTSEFMTYKSSICWGVIAEDSTATDNTHYFHPETHVNSYSSSIEDAGDLANSRYSWANTYYDANNKQNAFKYLGRAVHFVADLTNPYHSKGVSNWKHTAMENWVDGEKDAFIRSVNANYNTIYGWSASGNLLSSNTAKGFVDYAAHASYYRYSEVDSYNEWKSGTVVNDMLALAVRLTAGLFFKFWNDAINTPPDDGCVEINGILICP